MSIYSTIDITREEAEEIIFKKILYIKNISDKRLIEVLEALVQDRDYDDQHDEYNWNNFYMISADTSKTSDH